MNRRALIKRKAKSMINKLIKVDINDDLHKYSNILSNLLDTNTQFYEPVLNTSDNLDLIQTILILNKLGYKFPYGVSSQLVHIFIQHLRNTQNTITYVSDEFKLVIEILLKYSIKYASRYLFNHYCAAYNKNCAFHYCMTILFNTNYEFTLREIKNIKNNDITYFNEQMHNEPILNYGNITYCIFALCNKNKIDETYFNKFILSIQNSIDVPLRKLVKILFQSLCHHDVINIDKSKLLISNLLDKVPNTNNNITAICNYVLTYCKNICYVLKMFLENDKTVNVFIDTMIKYKFLHKNMFLLFYAMKHNYVPTIEIINSLLSVSETFTCNHEHYDDDCCNYITVNCEKQVKLIDCLTLFSVLPTGLDCIPTHIETASLPNTNTFTIALNRGYVYTVKKLINAYNFVPDTFALEESGKSCNVNLIKEILCYKIDPTIKTLENVVSNSVSVYVKSTRYRRRRRSRVPAQYTKNSNVLVITKLLIASGLKVDLNVISMLLSIRVHLDNLENYNIPYDENLYFECFVNKHFPEEYMDKFTIDKETLKMRQFSHKGLDIVPTHKGLNYVPTHKGLNYVPTHNKMDILRIYQKW